MAEIGSLTGAFAALNALRQITESMIGLHDGALIHGKILELQSIILEAHRAASAAKEERAALLAQVRELEKKVARLKAWEPEELQSDDGLA